MLPVGTGVDFFVSAFLTVEVDLVVVFAVDLEATDLVALDLLAVVEALLVGLSFFVVEEVVAFLGFAIGVGIFKKPSLFFLH
jgi:hypothetical protein